MSEQHGIRKLVKSKRFWTLLGTMIVMVVNEVAPSVQIEPQWIVALGAMLIGGYSVQDAAREFGKNGGTSEVPAQD